MQIMLCAICNIASGNCSGACKYCTQSAFVKTKIQKYRRKEIAQIVYEAKMAKKNEALGFCLVTAGLGLDDEKLEYLINLYTNLLTRQISYEMFINTLEFLETASTYEIAMAIKLYKKEKINDELGYLYIKKLVNHNLIEARWGVLNGPSVNPNEYELNEYGEKIISSLLSVKKYLE